MGDWHTTLMQLTVSWPQAVLRTEVNDNFGEQKSVIVLARPSDVFAALARQGSVRACQRCLSLQDLFAHLK